MNSYAQQSFSWSRSRLIKFLEKNTYHITVINAHTVFIRIEATPRIVATIE